MFGTSKKLKNWLENGLISQEQSTAIIDFEKSRSKTTLGRGVTGIALLTILIGILSIIAANWGYIGKEIKLALHILINISVAFGIYYAHKHNKKQLLEGLTFTLLGLNLTFIALIGQVFQSSGDLPKALLLWMIISTPALFMFGRTYLTGLPWILFFPPTILFYFVTYLHDSNISDFYAISIIQSFAILLPLAIIILSRNSRFMKFNPLFSELFIRMSFVFLIISATIASLFWYTDTTYELTREYRKFHLFDKGENFPLTWAIFNFSYFIAFAGFAILWKIRNSYKNNIEGRGLFLIAFTSITMIAFCVSIPHADNDLIAMISFITYWLIIALISYAHHFDKIITLAIALIAIRIFIIYLEAFGGLLSTGLGLIISGIFLLAMIYGFNKLNSFIRIRKQNNG